MILSEFSEDGAELSRNAESGAGDFRQILSRVDFTELEKRCRAELGLQTGLNVVRNIFGGGQNSQKAFGGQGFGKRLPYTYTSFASIIEEGFKF